jgi:hypothetical protein
MESQTSSQLSSSTARAANPAVLSPVVFGRDEAQRLLAQLAEPFDASVVEWVVTATAAGKNGQRGLLAAYADPRAYLDRLNQLFTPCGWTQDYSFQVVGNVERKGRDGKVLLCAKVMVCCRVTIFGIGTHAGTGEHWADDENAVTGGDAQAFKRACVCFGLGRYLYDVPQVWVDLDKFKRPRWFPDLPESALPQAVRGKGSGNVGASRKSGNGHNGSSPVSNSHGNGHSNAGAAGNGRDEALKDIQTLSTRVGRNIFRSVLVGVAGVDDPAQVGDVGKLKAIVERLESADRGIQRLKAAVEKVGREAHAALCRELKLASALTDDIPDTRVLRQLVDRLEQQAGAGRGTKPGSETPGSKKGAEGNASGRNGAASGSDFVGLRNEVLTVARRLAGSSRRPIADIIVWASDGAFQYADIGKLTPADLSKLQTAVRRLQAAVNEPKP